MSVVGIDFGAQSTKIGVARNKGIDIVSIRPRLRPFLCYDPSNLVFRSQMKLPIARHRKFTIFPPVVFIDDN